MIKIQPLNLFVGTKEEYNEAVELEMSIVCAMNTGDGVSYRSVVGKTSSDHPDYLFRDDKTAIYLNLIDGDDSKYISDKMINAALQFIDRNLSDGKNVFVYCSEGKSRSPSIAFMYLMERNILLRGLPGLMAFHVLYPHYVPGKGIASYIVGRYFASPTRVSPTKE